MLTLLRGGEHKASGLPVSCERHDGTQGSSREAPTSSTELLQVLSWDALLNFTIILSLSSEISEMKNGSFGVKPPCKTSIISAAAKHHIDVHTPAKADVCDLCCCQTPRWCLWSVLPPETTLIPAVCVANGNHVNVCDLCCQLLSAGRHLLQWCWWLPIHNWEGELLKDSVTPYSFKKKQSSHETMEESPLKMSES